MNIYEALTDIGMFYPWFQKFKAYSAANGLKILDPSYQPDPNDPIAVSNYEHQQTWTYSVLLQNLQFVGADSIMTKHAATFDAQYVIYDLCKFAIESPAGKLFTSNLFSDIVGSGLDSSWHKPILAYLEQFQKRVDEFIARSYPAVIPEDMLKSMLSHSLSTHEVMSNVMIRDSENSIHTGQEYTYSQYLNACRAAAAVEDSKRRQPRSSHRSRSPHRLAANAHETTSTGDDSDEDAQLYRIMVTSTGARISDEAWRNLDINVKKAWLKMPLGDRAILAEAITKTSGTSAPSSPAPPALSTRGRAKQRQVNFTDLESLPEPDPGPPSSSTGILVNTAKRGKTTLFADQAAREAALNAAHPGDPRKVLSVPPKPSPASTGTVIANMAKFDKYWGDTEDFRPGDSL